MKGARCLGVADLHDGTPEGGRDMAASARGIAVCRSVEVHDQRAVPAGCECRIVGQRNDDIRLQPGVCLLWRSVVCIVVHIRNDVGELRQRRYTP